jgi:hypothetical protein
LASWTGRSYQPAALAKKRENQQNWLTHDPEVKCCQLACPARPHAATLQILQSEKALFFAYQYAGAARHLGDPGPAAVDSWMGHSIGKWEATLVIDVTASTT